MATFARVVACVALVAGAAAEYSSPTYSRSACRAVVGSSFKRYWVGDGYCDDPKYNKEACDWDGGDCCEDTCVSESYTCGNYYNCLDPAAGACPATCEGSYTCDEYLNSSPDQTCSYLEDNFGCNCAGCDCVEPEEPCVDYLGVDCSIYGEVGDFAANLLCYDVDSDGRTPQMESCCTCRAIAPKHDYLVPWDYHGMVEIEGPSSSVSQSDASSYFQTGYDYPSLDDACYLVEYPTTIFGLSYDDVWICANGVLSFGEAELAYTPIPIPYSTFPMIAAFWADVDVRCGSGSLNNVGGCGADGGNAFGYAIVSSSDDSDPEGQLYVASVGQHIKALYNADFTATTVLVTTWHEVGYYSLKTDKLNSFQIVLASDDVNTGESFACLYFKDIEWSLGQVSGSTHAQVGFDKGDFSTYYAHPDSTTSSIADIGSDGEPICYRIDTGEICDPGEVYVDVATGCVPQGCNSYSADGAFADAYLQPSTSGGCDFDLDHGESCALQCAQGRIAAADSTMTTTCEAGVLLDPGPQCVSPGITITPSSLNLLEGGDGDVFYIQALTPVYDDPVTVAIAADDATAVEILDSDGNSVSQVQFTAENWNSPVTITVAAIQNTKVASTDVSVSVSFSVASVNTAYSSLSLEPVTVNIEDDDYAAINVVTSGELSVSETSSSLDACDRSNDATQYVQYSLSSEPSSTVTINFEITGSNAALGQICDSARLVFTSSNWDEPQSLFVAAVASDEANPSGLSFSVSGSVDTDDSNYDGLSVASVSIGYNDNDVAGFNFLADGTRQMYEGGDDVDFNMAFDSRPTDSVVFDITSNDTAHCALVGAASDGTLSITIADALWENRIAFSVTAVDDNVIDPLIVCEITVTTSSGDSDYDGLVTTALVEKYETDVASFSIAVPSSGYLAVSEGGSNTLTTTLSAVPSSPVTVSASVFGWDDSVGDEPSTTSVTINPSAWSSTANKVVVSCPENLIHDSGTASVVNATLFQLTITTQSDDPLFDGLPSQVVTGFCEDNDVAGVTVGTSSTTCGCDAYVDGASYTDTVVCAVLQDGGLDCYPPGSDGSCADGFTECVDDGSAFEGRSVTNVYLKEGEDGQTFSLRLLSVPTDAVVFSCESSDSSRVSTTLEEATLTPTDSSVLTDMILWLDVAAVADDIDHNTTAFSVTCSLSSDDEHYDGISRVFLRGAVSDDDVAAVSYSPLSAKTYETDTTSDPTTETAFSVHLDTEPTADVVISASLSAGAPADIVSGTSLTFSADDWDVDQQVILQGQDDDVAQSGPTTFTLSMNVASTDAGYGNVAPIVISVDNINDDVVGLAIAASSEVTSEDPASPFNPATFSVTLKSQPLDSVTISCSTSDSGVALCSSDIEFSTANWATSQVFQVTGVDNDVAGADAVYTVSLSSSSSDSAYDNLEESYSMTNLNDDIAGVAVTHSGTLVTSEDVSVDPVSVCVALESEPTSLVDITVASSDTTEALVEGASSTTVSFSSSNWNVAQCVDVQGQPDLTQDGTASYSVSFVATSSDSSYDAISIEAVSLENLDIDVAGFSLSTGSQSLVTSEDGAGVAISIVLDTIPSADVVLCGASSDETEGTFPSGDDACVTFDSSDWDVAQIIEITGVDDDIVDGSISYQGVISVSDTTDSNYNALSSQAVLLANLDNDVAGVTIAQSGLETSEAGASQTLSLALDSQPYANVTVLLTCSDSTEGSLSSEVITFTPDNYDTVQVVTVTGVADNVDDGNQAYSVALSVSSTDADYDSLSLANRQFSNTDDDTAEVVAAASGSQTYESGQSLITVSVLLGTEPSETVTISAVCSDGTEASVTPSSVDFDSANYDKAQTFTVSGLKDYMVDGTIDYTLTLSTVTSATEYSSLSDSVFSFANVDEDEAGLVVSESSVSVDESGSTDSFTVKLSSKPSEDVVVTSSSSDSTEGSVPSGSPLTFTSTDWNTTQTVTVRGVDDDLVDGESTFSINIAAVSSDDNYNDGNVDTSVAAYNQDDDFASLVFSSCVDSTPVVHEGSTATACFEASLTSEPYFDVSVAMTTDATEGTVQPAVLVFSATNWSTPQQLALSAVDDDFEDGSQSYCVTAATSSTDDDYNSFSTCITAATVDNDVASLHVTPANEHVVIDEGDSGNFSLVLTAAPENGDAVVQAAVPQGTATLTVSTFTFTADDWDVPQLCVYHANEDSTVLGFGELDFNIVFNTSASVDTLYASLDDVTVSVVVTEDDTAGIAVSTADVLTAEGSPTSDTVEVSLDSVPTSGVNVTCFSTDTSEAIVSPSSLVFADMSTQSFSIVGQDDNVADGPQSYIIVCAAASDDANYDGLFGFNVSGTNADDDFAELDVVISGVGTSESGKGQTFSVRLTSEPEASVTVAVGTSDSSEGDATPTVLTFTPSDYDAAQNISVVGVDDCYVDGTVGYNVSIIASSSDANYDGLSAIEAFSNVDNDYMSIALTSSSQRTTEAGSCVDLVVSLSARPYGELVFTVSTSDAGEGAIDNGTAFSESFDAILDPNDYVCSDGTLQFTACGINDDLDDGDVSYTLSVECTAVSDSRDARVFGASQSVQMVNEDDDSSAVGLSTNSSTNAPLGRTLQADENGNPSESADGDLYLRINSEPYDTVVATVVCNDTSEVVIRSDSSSFSSTAVFTFTPENWQTNQRVFYQGVDDDLVDGTAFVLCSVSLQSDDNQYDGLTTSFNVKNFDNDVAGAIASSTADPVTTEAGQMFAVSVVLEAEPFDTVTISASVSDDAQGVVVPSSIDILPENWAVPITFNVTGVDNDIVDGTVAYTVSFESSSSDDNFDALVISSIAAENLDDDVGGFTATLVGSATTAEPTITCCTSTEIEVVLTAEPQANVNISVCSSDFGGTEGTVSLSSSSSGAIDQCVFAIFTASDWTEAQTVYVTGGNDDIDDGNQAYNVYFSSSSTDVAFDGSDASIGLVNVDDDVASVSTQLPATPARVYEGNATQYSYSIVLTSQPIDDVAISLTSSNEDQITVDPSVLTFTSATWDVAQSVHASSVDNYLDEGDVSASIVATVTSATDANYDGLEIADVDVLCVNNDVASIAVTLSAGSASVTTEAGGTVTLDVALTAEPSTTVSLSVSVSDLTEAKVRPGSAIVTFTPSDYADAQQIVIEGVPDDMVDGNIEFEVSFEVASGTYEHSGVSATASYTLSNSDIDVASLIVVADGSASVSEDGTSTGYLFQLSSKPYAAVTVVAQVSDSGELTASASGRSGSAVTISFSDSNWDTQKEISFTGVDDDVADGPQAVQVSFTLQSEDADYDGLVVTPVRITNNDNDVASIDVVAPFSVGVVSENQAGVTFTLALTSEPFSDVVINASSSDNTVGVVNGTGIFVFTTDNWSEAQTVTVAAVTTASADRIVDFAVNFDVASDDLGYDGFVIDAIDFEKIDVTTVGIVRNVYKTTTYEDPSFPTADVSVSVLSQPHEDVIVYVSSSNTAEGTVSPTALTFTASNWQTVQTATVSGVDDNVDDGNIDYNVTLTAVSADTDYDGFELAPVTFTNINDDRAGVVSSQTGSLILYESIALNDLDYGDDEQPALCVVLQSEPLADVLASVQNSEPTQAVVGASSLLFTPLNWDVQQCVTVDPLDDFVADGNARLTVGITFSSDDPNYDNVESQSVEQAYQVVDNDYSGISLSTTGVAIVEGESESVSVALESEPTATVTISLSPQDSQAAVSTAALTFTAANWNVPQIFNISAVHDFIDDGDVSSTVQVASSSADSEYTSHSLNITVETLDIDVAGLRTVAPSSGLTDVSEEGDSESFGIKLLSKPLSSVTLVLSTTDDTECALADDSIDIAPDEWDSPATVTVIGLDDLIFDQDQPCGIVIDSISSSDPLYDSLPVESDELIQFTNIDDDVAGIVCAPLAHTTSEADLSPSTSVVTLTSQPLQPVSISYSSSDPTEGIATGTIVLDETNWFIGQPVTITPVDDDLADGPQSYTVDFEAAVSAGFDYSGMVPDFEISVTNLDNNTAGILIKVDGESQGRRLEESANFSFAAAACSEANATSVPLAVRLTSRPYGDVAFRILAPEDEADAERASRVMPAVAANTSIEITPSTWDSWQEIDLSCQSDNMATGDFEFSITFDIESSDPDYEYADLEPEGITISFEDSDTAGVIVALGVDGTEDRLETNSTGRSDVMSLVLTSRPFDDIVISLQSKAPAQGELSADALTFTASNWNEPQTVTITGLDGGDDNAQLYDISLAVEPADSRSDFAYDRLTLDAVAVLNTYPTVIQLSEFEYANFAAFATSQTGLWVWIAIGIALLILIILIVVIVVNRHRHKKEIEKERKAAVAARESMLAGADDIDAEISWNGDDGIEMSNVDSLRTYEKEYDGIIKKLQREATRLKATNERLAQQAGVESLALNGADQSQDVMQLFSTIRELKASNSDLEARATNSSDSARLLHAPKTKKKKQAVFGQSQI